jgi:hypothetical protein
LSENNSPGELAIHVLDGSFVDKEMEFIDTSLDFYRYTAENSELLLGKNAVWIWRFPGQ